MKIREEFMSFLSLLVLSLFLCTCKVNAAVSLQSDNLEWHYYKVHNTCDDAEAYIQHQVRLFWENDTSVTPKLVRLLYSDCFVTGCDASILLDGPNSERTAPQNSGLGAFIVIDKIKTVLENRCKGVVSCADILNLATRDAVHLAGGPSYPVLTGRRDGMKSSAASVDLPSPSISWEASLGYFKSKGLDELDMTTLLGAHTVGRTHCRYITDRLYNYNNTGKADPSMNTTILEKMRSQCPPKTRKGQTDPLVFLNQQKSNYMLSESYYSNVLSSEALLGVDQQLLYGNNTAQMSQEFAASFEDFRKALALSMSRMGNINVLTGKQGEIRLNCQKTN